MAQISLTIPDAALDRVIDALCARGTWTPELGIPRGQFAKQQLAAWLKEEVKAYERAKAERAVFLTVVDPTVVDIT